MLLNSNHPRSRQNLTCAHEIGHWISTRPNAEILEGENDTSSLEERFATAFSMSLLLPAMDVRARFLEHVRALGRFTPRQLLAMANFYEVSAEGMCRRLEGLELLPSGTFESLKRRGFKPTKVELVERSHAISRTNPTRVFMLAAEALHRGLASESQLVDMLGIPRVQLRQQLDLVDADGPEDLLG